MRTVSYGPYSGPNGTITTSQPTKTVKSVVRSNQSTRSLHDSINKHVLSMVKSDQSMHNLNTKYAGLFGNR